MGQYQISGKANFKIKLNKGIWSNKYKLKWLYWKMIQYLYLDAVITLITKKQNTLYNTIILVIKIIYIIKKKLSSADCQISRSEQNESSSTYCY